MAFNDKGEIAKGRLSAATEKAATDLLGYAGYKVVSLKPQVQFPVMEKLSSRLSRVKPSEIILFHRQLALLLESGINITTSLELLQDHASSRTLKRVLGEVIADLRSGNQLSAALIKHPEVFSPIHCRSLSVGEQTGSLETILRQIADHIEKRLVAAKSVKGALVYPIIASIVAVVVVGVLVTFVIPAFGDLYTSLGAEIPPMTKFLMDIAQIFQSYGVYIILALLIVTGLAVAYTKTVEGKYKLDTVLLGMPLLGRVYHLNELATCCRSIALLFRAGLPLTEIIPLVIQSSGNSVVSRAFVGVQQDMLVGEGLSQPMAKNSVFLPMMVQMVKVGEETGNLDTTLSAVAESYENEADDRTRSLIALIQPAMTIIIGLVVGMLALSLVSAMYSLYGQML